MTEKNRKEKCVGIEPCNKGSTGLLSKTIETIDSEHYIFSSQKRLKMNHYTLTSISDYSKGSTEMWHERTCQLPFITKKLLAIMLGKNGTPPALLMSIYNHSSYEITKRYLGIEQLDKDEVYEKMFFRKNLKS